MSPVCRVILNCSFVLYDAVVYCMMLSRFVCCCLGISLSMTRFDICISEREQTQTTEHPRCLSQYETTHAKLGRKASWTLQVICFLCPSLQGSTWSTHRSHDVDQNEVSRKGIGLLIVRGLPPHLIEADTCLTGFAQQAGAWATCLFHIVDR